MALSVMVKWDLAAKPTQGSMPILSISPDDGDGASPATHRPRLSIRYIRYIRYTPKNPRDFPLDATATQRSV